MTCATAAERIWQSLDGDLPEAAADELVAHLRQCPTCQATLTEAVRIHRSLLEAALSAPVGSGTQTLAARRPTRRPSGRTGSFRRRAVWLVPAACALLLLAVVLGIDARRAPVPDPIAFAWISEPQAKNGERRQLAPGEEIVTGAGEIRQIQVADGSRIQVDADTRIRLALGGQRRAGGAIGLRGELSAGRVEVEAVAQDPAAPLVILTPLAEAVVVGTAFSLQHDATGSELRVSHGVVRFTAEAIGEQQVSAGNTLRVVQDRLLAVFTASSLSGKDGESVISWRDPSRQLVAAPGLGEVPPLGKVCTSRYYTVAFNGETQALHAPLGALDAAEGLTLLVVASPLGDGHDERIATLNVAETEYLALVRNGPLLGCVVDGRVWWSDRPWSTGKETTAVLSCTWRADGTFTLRSGQMVLLQGQAVPPRNVAAASLDLAAPGHGRRFHGNLFAAEVHGAVAAIKPVIARMAAAYSLRAP
jgi:ferric-dicitrate binding protein FerR (iron transport regulator)